MWSPRSSTVGRLRDQTAARHAGGPSADRSLHRLLWGRSTGSQSVALAPARAWTRGTLFESSRGLGDTLLLGLTACTTMSSASTYARAELRASCERRGGWCPTLTSLPE